MRTPYYFIVNGLLAVTALAGAAAADAQVQALMPALYNASGQEVNASNSSALPAGWYYLQSDAAAASKIYYYGNGVYYDPAIGLYGGSAVHDPNGTAGVALGYAASVLIPASAPNTGAGGDASRQWLILLVSGLVMAAGASYVVGALARESWRQRA
ncbi:MAG: hypothetical protein KGI69_00455 [Patescibacteria group bacterium]|nr:hypothetical protein [Patescibacteria group bacterium]